jgi:hypothetical protein
MALGVVLGIYRPSVVMAGLAPAIHVKPRVNMVNMIINQYLTREGMMFSWMAATSAAMTVEAVSWAKHSQSNKSHLFDQT